MWLQHWPCRCVTGCHNDIRRQRDQLLCISAVCFQRTPAQRMSVERFGPTHYCNLHKCFDSIDIRIVRSCREQHTDTLTPSCCECAARAIHHPPPRSLMNSRRFIGPRRSRPHQPGIKNSTQESAGDVRWVKAHIPAGQRNVSFTPNSGHVQCNSVCPLSANSGHNQLFDHLVGAG